LLPYMCTNSFCLFLGMELSELVTFDGKLLTVDDRTGIVYEIVEDQVVPWVILADGNGRMNKGFKAEWATVKDQTLYVGGHGTEFISREGVIINYNPQWIKTVSVTGEVDHINWREKYLALAKTAGIEFPGYITHEAGVWSDVHQKWFFLPRKCSDCLYDDDEDEQKCTNLLITCDDNFENIQVSKVGEIVPSHGFSSFKFVPGTDDQVIVAIKSEEVGDSAASFILAFTVEGEILLPETKIADVKYEGLEFI